MSLAGLTCTRAERRVSASEGAALNQFINVAVAETLSDRRVLSREGWTRGSS
jgi:hypothetical protein